MIPLSVLLLVSSIFALGCSQTKVNKISLYHTGEDDSNTINSLTAVNPASGSFGGTAYPGQIYNSLANEDAGRWREQGFKNFVSTTANQTACLGGTGAGLTMTPTSCVAYNAGYRGTETGSIVFPNAATTWVAMDENTSGSNAGLPHFTRVGTTHYLTDSIDATQPIMAFDSQLLMKVVTSGGAITAVTDLRNFGVSQSSVVNVLNFGAVCDDSTDNATAFKNAINGLPIINGEPQGIVVVPACFLGYAIKTANTVVVPRGVQLTGANGNSATLDCSSLSSGACVVEGDAAGYSPFLGQPVVQGEISHLNFLGPGSGSSVIAIYRGGDPAGVISSSSLDADHFTEDHLKIKNFGVGIQNGNNAFEDLTDTTQFYLNNTGYNDPSGTSDSGERMTFTNDDFNSNVTAAMALNNQFSQTFVDHTSYDTTTGNANQIVGQWILGAWHHCHIEENTGNQIMVHAATGSGGNMFAVFDACDFNVDAGSGTTPEFFLMDGLQDDLALKNDSFFSAAGSTVTQIAKFSNAVTTNDIFDFETPMHFNTATTMPQIVFPTTPWPFSKIITDNAFLPAAQDYLPLSGPMAPTRINVNGASPQTNSVVNGAGLSPNNIFTCKYTNAWSSGFCYPIFNSSGAFVGGLDGGANLTVGKIIGNGTPGISGGGSLATGSNSFAGAVTSVAATGNVLTPGFTCPNKVTMIPGDETTAGGAKVTASSTTTVTFSATASDTVDYLTGCR